MSDELIDIVDENLNNIGVATKKLAHATGLWHFSIHCWVVGTDDSGEWILLQKRAATKDLFPNCLDITAAGHYKSGENPEDGVREIIEELGISVSFSQLVPLGIKVDLGLAPGILNREFCRVYLLNANPEVSAYSPDPSEVSGLVRISVADGLRLFSGESDMVRASGVEWNENSREWESLDVEISCESFIPRVDSYYYKVLILAERFLKGETHLAI